MYSNTECGFCGTEPYQDSVISDASPYCDHPNPSDQRPYSFEETMPENDKNSRPTPPDTFWQIDFIKEQKAETNEEILCGSTNLETAEISLQTASSEIREITLEISNEIQPR